MNKIEIISTIIVAVITSGGFNVILTHFLHSKKLKKEQRMGYKNMIGEKISEALLAVRDLELKCSVIEIYEIENELNNKSFDSFGVLPIYPAITSNDETWFDFFNQVMNARKEYEKYLGFKEASYLYYMERYCENFIHIVGSYKINLKEAGAIFVADFQNWQKQYEKLLVKRINNPKYKVYDKNSKRWEYAKEKVMKKLWDRSLLRKFKDNEEVPEVTIMKALIVDKDEEKALNLMYKYQNNKE